MWVKLKITKNNPALAQKLRHRGSRSYESLADFFWSCDERTATWTTMIRPPG
jgi:hypothetical protein